METTTLWFIPDIHGEVFQLENLLLQLGERRVDRVIFGGDMIDRGRYSREVVELVKGLCEVEPERYLALYGNHEDLMVNAHDPLEPEEQLWFINGGWNTLQSYGGDNKKISEHLDWFKTLPLFHVEQGFWFSHAPIPVAAKKPYKKETLIWSYPGRMNNEGFFAKHFLEENLIGVCGHVHALQDNYYKPRLYPHYIYADAGCGCSSFAPLVAVEVKTREILYAFRADLPNRPT